MDPIRGELEKLAEGDILGRLADHDARLEALEKAVKPKKDEPKPAHSRRSEDKDKS